MGTALASERNSRGAAYGDIDDDGDVDIIIATAGGAHQVLLNQGEAGYWLTVAGAPLGARVTVRADSGTITEHSFAGGTYAGNHDARLHFGLANDCRADVEVRHLDGTETLFETVDANQILRVDR